jgi:hypothetical protein
MIRPITDDALDEAFRALSVAGFDFPDMDYQVQETMVLTILDSLVPGHGYVSMVDYMTDHGDIKPGESVR